MTGPHKVVVGDGLTTREREVWPLLRDGEWLQPHEVMLNRLDAINNQAPWVHIQNDVREWLALALPSIRLCPGKDDARCCNANFPTAEMLVAMERARANSGRENMGWACTGGKWRERIDREWYIGKIWQMLSVTSDAIARNNSAYAAEYAFELADLLAEARWKFEYEVYALRSIAQAEGHVRGGLNSRRASDADRIAEIQLRIDAGHSKKRAIELVSVSHAGERGWGTSILNRIWGARKAK